jgi:hypothetical protein
VTAMTAATIREQAQWALQMLNCSHPDTGITEFGRVLEHIDPDSRDARVIQRAIDWLEEIAVEITQVEAMLAQANFTFGKIEV